jgi:hypothetical protein
MSWKGYTLYSSGGDAKNNKYYQLLTFQQPYVAIEYTYTPAQPAVPGSMFSRAKPAVEESVTQKEVTFQDQNRKLPYNPLPNRFMPTSKQVIPNALKEYLTRDDDINWKISFLDLTPFDELHKTSPDGNCLFASIADQAFLLSEQPLSPELSLYTPYCRKLAMIDILLNDKISVNTLIPNSSNASSVTPNSSTTIPAIKDAYINSHKEDGIEGGEPEIAALSDILQCPIYVWELNEEQTGIKELYNKSGRYGIDFFSDKQVINIVRYKLTGTGYHYDALHTRHMPCKPFSYSIYTLPYYSETIKNATDGGEVSMQRFRNAKDFFKANLRVKAGLGASSGSSNAPVIVSSAPSSSNAAGVFPSNSSNAELFSSSSSSTSNAAPFSSSSSSAPINDIDLLFYPERYFKQDATKLIFSIDDIYKWVKECCYDKRDVIDSRIKKAETKPYSLDTLRADFRKDLYRRSIHTINNIKSTPMKNSHNNANVDNFVNALKEAYPDLMSNDYSEYFILTLLSYNMTFTSAKLVNIYANSIHLSNHIKYNSINAGGLVEYNLRKAGDQYEILIKTGYKIVEDQGWNTERESSIRPTYVRVEWKIRLDSTMHGPATCTIEPVPRDIDFLDIATGLSKSRSSNDIEITINRLANLWISDLTIKDRKALIATYKAQLAASSKNQANAKRKSNNATRKRSNSITKLAEKPLGFLKTTRFGFNTPDRARYRKLIPAVKLELENLFEDNYNEVDRALNTQCMTDFFIHYIQELEKAGIAPGEPAAIAYYLTNGCNKSLLEVIDKSISLLLKELKVLINATKAPRPVNIPTSANAKYSIANKLIDRLIIFLNIYKKQTIDDGINKLLSAFLKELFTIKDSDKLPSLRIPMTNLITALRDIRGVNPSFPLKNATNRGKNSPICDIEAEIAPIVNEKYSQVWDHWLNRYIRYEDPKDAGKTSKPLTLSHMAPPDKINILFFKIYLEYERLVQLVKTVSRNNSLFDACISPKGILLQIERANSIRKGKYEDLEHFIKQIFLKIYRQIFMIEYIHRGSPEISPDQVDTILSSIRVPPIREVSNRFYVPRPGNRGSSTNSNYAFPNLVSILYALENAPEIHPTEFELLSDEEFKGLLERIPSFSVSELYGLIQSIESKTNYNTKSRGYIRIQTILKEAKEAMVKAARSRSQSLPTRPFSTENGFITPEPNAPFVPTPPNKSRSATPQPPPNKPRSASIGGFRYLTQKKQNKKHRRTRRSKGRKSAN